MISILGYRLRICSHKQWQPVVEEIYSGSSLTCWSVILFPNLKHTKIVQFHQFSGLELDFLVYEHVVTTIYIPCIYGMESKIAEAVHHLLNVTCSLSFYMLPLSIY
jgi:hypothetical protein